MKRNGAMRLLTQIFLAVCTILTVGGCNSRREAQRIEQELQGAKSLTISYLLPSPGGEKELTISKASDVSDIVSALSVKHNVRGMHFKTAGFSVDFVMPEGEPIRLTFVRSPDELTSRGRDWGMVYLNDGRFYKKVCEAISKAEGKPLDPLSYLE